MSSQLSGRGSEAPSSVSHIADALPDRLASTEELQDRVFVLVYRQMHALWGRFRVDFDDLVQTASEQAVRSLPSFRRDSDLSTWTYRICYRAVLRHQRWSMRWLRRFTLNEPLVDAPDVRLDAGAVLEERERARRLHRALEELSEKRRAVVVLRDLEGLDMEEIARIVGANEATVRSRLRDGRRQLGNLLEEDSYFGTEACAAESP